MWKAMEWDIVNRKIPGKFFSIEHKKQFCKGKNECKMIDYPHTWIPADNDYCFHCEKDFPDGLKMITRLMRL